MLPSLTAPRLFASALKSAASMLAGLLMLEAYCLAAAAVGYRTERTVERRPRDLEELTRLSDSTTANRDPCGFQILVLGDSMAFSPGVPYEDLWSTRLESELERQLGQCVRVVNAATAGGNTFEQLVLARKTLEVWQPNLVLLMYNYNDVNGERAPPVGGSGDSENGTTGAGEAPQSARQLPLLARVIRGLSSARSLRLILLKTGLQLKSWGVVVPGSEFSQLVQDGYGEESQGWRAVQGEIRELHTITSSQGASLAIYTLPQMDTLCHDLFAGPRQRLDQFLDDEAIPHAFGWSVFRDRDWNELAMSPFDGHPNSHANREIALAVLHWLSGSGLTPHVVAQGGTEE